MTTKNNKLCKKNLKTLYRKIIIKDKVKDKDMYRYNKMIEKSLNRRVGVQYCSIIGKIYKYDEDTFSHCLRVGFISGYVAFQMGMNKKTVEKVFLGGLVHDLGKVLIPYEILHKPSKLTETEKYIMSQHSDYGAEMLSLIDDIDNLVIEITKNHHRFSDDILTRIVTVVDNVDALMTERAYKEAFTPEKTYNLIQGNRIIFEKEDFVKNVINIHRHLF